MFSGMVLPSVMNLSDVNTILQDVVQRTSGIGSATRPVPGSAGPLLAPDTLLIEPELQFRDASQFQVQVKETIDELRFLRIYD